MPFALEFMKKQVVRGFNKDCETKWMWTTQKNQKFWVLFAEKQISGFKIVLTKTSRLLKMSELSFVVLRFSTFKNFYHVFVTQYSIPTILLHLLGDCS